MTEHPITPPPEQLVRLWSTTITNEQPVIDNWTAIATKAAYWGADQELEACCEWFAQDWSDTETAAALRATRRPKPLSLKEEALAALAAAEGADHPVVATVLTADQHATIRRALESLPD